MVENSDNLPNTFLRTSSQDDQCTADAEYARQLQDQEEQRMRHRQAGLGPTDDVGFRSIRRLHVTICEAKLVKPQGLFSFIKLDPYARVRVGHTMYSTHTHRNGDDNPIWDRPIIATLPAGITEIFVEVFDEKSFSEDERIAFGIIPLDEQVLVHKKTVTKFYPLIGPTPATAEESLGEIKLVISLAEFRENVLIRGGALDPSNIRPLDGPNSGAVNITDRDVMEIREMFPGIDRDTIRSILVSNGGNKEMAVQALLSMS